MSIDNCKHSVFGASKVSADIMVQEYGKYFDLNTVSFRGGCLTGQNHKGSEMHGFLSYLIKCMIKNKSYNIFGYKGKQVRDNIYSNDLVDMFWSFHLNPKKGEVYNAGGGRENSISIIEAIEKINNIANINWNKHTILEENRIGDHKWYITNLNKFNKDYPNWKLNHSIDKIIYKMIQSEMSK
jgi:CDP-paratose 2-epimerase